MIAKWVLAWAECMPLTYVPPPPEKPTGDQATEWRS